MDKRLFFAILLGAVFLFFSAGCGQDSTAPAPKPSRQAAKPPPKKAVDKEVAKKRTETPTEYVYDSTGRRDPFQSPLDVKKSIRPSGTPLTPLQRFEIEQLRLMGIIIGKGEPRALVVAPDDKSYILKVGTKVGRHDGKIVEIKREAIVVEEPYIDFTGAVRTGIKEIKVPEREGAE